VSHFVRLDAVVTTVDAVNGLRQIDEHAEAVKQAALADRLLLTKTDLAAAEAIHALKERLADLNPGAARHTVANGEIAPDALFGAALFDPSRKSVDIDRWINERAYQARGDDHGGHHHGEHGHGEHEHGGHGHGEHGHDSDIRACCLTSDEPLSWDAVSSWLSRLRKGAGNDLLRVKGILNLVGESAPVAIHGVHHVFHPPVQLDAWPDADRRSRIVFITRGIDHADLEASFLEHVAGARV
jgi:G3E family GTPase